MLNEQSNKSSGLRTTELIANFFVNAISSEKRFCPLILHSLSPEAPLQLVLQCTVIWTSSVSPKTLWACSLQQPRKCDIWRTMSQVKFYPARQVFTILFALHIASAFDDLLQVRQFQWDCFLKATNVVSFWLQESRAVQQCAINSLQISLCWSRSSLTLFMTEQQSQKQTALRKKSRKAFFFVVLAPIKRWLPRPGFRLPGASLG